MKNNSIVGAYIGFVGAGGGKRRPILIVQDDQDMVYFYRITSKYQNKSAQIKSKYYPIRLWHEAGLNKQSYIDTELAMVQRKQLKQMNYFGQLQKIDQVGLANFIKNRLY